MKQHDRDIWEGATRRPASAEESGAVLITVAFSLTLLFGMIALSVDIGRVFKTRAVLQDATDVAALAGARALASGQGLSEITAACNASLSQSASLSGTVVTNATLVVDVGEWNSSSATFSSSGLSSADAVKVELAISEGGGTSVGSIFGSREFELSVAGTARTQYVGSVSSDQLPIPFSIGCCRISGSNCDESYCDSIAGTPFNSCALSDPQNDGITHVSCMEGRNRSYQNMCWSLYREPGTSVSNSLLRNWVNGTRWGETVSTGEDYQYRGYRRNTVVQLLRDKFYGNNSYSGNPSGTDRYSPFDGDSDSWVVPVPVQSCRSSTNMQACRTQSDTSDVLGFACAEIREITGNTVKLRMLCGDDPLFSECAIDSLSGGGANYGVSAGLPLLVN